MTEEQFYERLSALADGESIDPREAVQALAHPDAARELSALFELRRLIAADTAAPTAGARADTERAMARTRRFGVPAWLLSAAAALVLGGAVGWYGSALRRHDPAAAPQTDVPRADVVAQFSFNIGLP